VHAWGHVWSSCMHGVTILALLTARGPMQTHPQTRMHASPPGNSALAASLAARQSRLAAIHDSLKGLDALGDEAERARVEKLVALVDKARVEPGEERRLRAQLRSMEARRSSLEQVGAI
jgi:hypothetical protein